MNHHDDDDDSTIDDEQTESNDASPDPTREAWERLRESSILLGQVLDEKTGFSRLWCGYVQPSLEESRTKLQRLDRRAPAVENDGRVTDNGDRVHHANSESRRK